MKKLIYFLIPLFLFIPKVYALDYTYQNVFAGMNASSTSGSFIADNGDIIGRAYYELPKTNAYPYIVLTYCSSSDSVQPGIASTNSYITDSIYHIDTRTYCHTEYGSVTGTIKQNIFVVKNWFYKDNEASAYFDVSYSYFHNSDSQHSQAVRFLGFSSQSSQDVSIGILAYLKMQQNNQDYTTILNEIKNNQNDYKRELQDVNSSIQETNDTLKDDTVDNSSLNIDDKSADLGNSPVSDLITLPIKLLTNIYNGFSGSCVSYNLGSLFGTDLIFPCINLESILGSFLWGLIDSLCCIFLIYKIAMLFVSMWTKIITMKDVFSSIYTPGGGN